MKEFTLSSYIIGTIIFCLIVAGAVALIGELMQTDTSFVDNDQYTDFNKTFNTYNNILNISNKTQSNIENMQDNDFGLLGVLSSLINQAWQFLRLLFQSLSFMKTTLLSISTMFPVPAWIPTLIGAIITILIGFAIYGIIFQRNA